VLPENSLPCFQAATGVSVFSNSNPFLSFSHEEAITIPEIFPVLSACTAASRDSVFHAGSSA
jgi:hypothetical protein